MATKSVGINLPAASPSSVGQAGINGGTYVVHILNRGAGAAVVEVGASTVDGTFQNPRRLVKQSVAVDEEFSFGPVVLNGNDYIIAESDIADVSVVMMGYDD